MEPTPDRYAHQLLDAIHRHDSALNVVYESAEFALRETDQNRVVNLTNIFAEYCSLDAEFREEHIARIVRVFFSGEIEVPDEKDALREHLMPKIWTRATMVMLELQQRLEGNEAPDMPLYPLGDHLFISLVYDLPDSMRSLSSEELEQAGLSYYEAMEAARENLADATGDFIKIGENLYSSVTGDNYDSSRIILDGMNEFEVNGDRVAIIPQRDSMFMTGSDDELGLELMLRMTIDVCESQPRPLSPIPIREVDGEWESWMPPETCPSYNEFAEVVARFYGGLYADQKEILDEIHENELIDIFIANFSGLQREEDNRLLTYCVWGEGVDSLLPKTDYMMLPTADGLAASGKWEDVANTVGDLLQPVPELYPPRYRVREFPSQL
ncbi:MAG: hypothetical protein ACI9G1_001706, partial [Pirellulaceae bacterium]